MPGAFYQARKFQAGIETAHGTKVPATWYFPGEFTITPARMRYMADYPRAVRFPVTGGGIDVMKGFTFTGNLDCCFEEIIYPLNTGLAVGVITTTTGVSTHVFTPNIAADPAPKSMSMEFWQQDGAGTNYNADGSTFGLTQKLSLSYALNTKIAETWSGFGQAESEGITPTAALTPLTNREVAISNLTSWYIDNTWSGLGGTQKLGTVRTAKLDFDFKLAPDPTMDGRANLDYNQYLFDLVGGHLQIVAELNAAAQTEIAAWNSKSQRFVRAKTTGSIIPTTSTPKSIQFDMSMVHTKEPAISRSGQVELMTFELDLEYDPTSAKGLIATIVNGLATLT